MSAQKQHILKNLLSLWPRNTVATMSWLESQNVSRFLKRKYQQSGWIQALGRGAFIRNGEKVDWEGGLYALQTQLNSPIHVGGLSSLDLQGRSHYLKFGKARLFLFTPLNLKVPKWFLNYQWSEYLSIVQTSLFDRDVGLISHTVNGVSVQISSPERAILEFLYTTPKHTTFEEVDLIFEHLSQLRPQVVQDLLENCKIFKVKRFFLFLGEKHDHPWMKQLNLDRIDLGTSVLSLTKGGIFVRKYNLMVPSQLVDNDESEILF
jgi:hypothetical protein